MQMKLSSSSLTVCLTGKWSKSLGKHLSKGNWVVCVRLLVCPQLGIWLEVQNRNCYSQGCAHLATLPGSLVQVQKATREMV